MTAASDFFGAIADASGVNSRSANTGDASGPSTASQAGSAFFSVIQTYARGEKTKVKQAIIDRAARSPTGKAAISHQRTIEIHKFLMNPVVWMAGIGALLIIGYFGYAWGKR